MSKKTHNRFHRLIPLLFIISFVVVLSVSFAANSLITYLHRTMEHNIEQRLIAVAERLAEFVSPEELEQYRNEEDMKLPSYQALRLRLLEFSIAADVLYVYFIRPNGNILRYIIDNDFDEATRVGLDTEHFYAHEIPWILPALVGISVCSGLGNYTPGWEGLLSAYAPVLGASGEVIAIAGVDIVDTSIVQAKRLVSILTVLQIIMVAVVFATGAIALVRFRRQAEIAKEASAYKSNFLANMSHEIKTPLTVISMYVQTAKKMFDVNTAKGKLIKDRETISHSLQRAQEEVMRVARITMNAIHFSLLQESKYNMKPLDITALLNECIEVNSVMIQNKGNRLISNITDNLPLVYGNTDLLTQLMVNLLTNSNTHTTASNDGANGEIGVYAQLSTLNPQLIEVTVTDTGSGISPELLPLVFERKTTGIGSTGLGLAICKEIVEAHHGTIEIESILSKGTKVTFMLPVFSNTVHSGNSDV